MVQGEIQDLLTSKQDNFWIGAIDFDETTVINQDDITILQNEEALWQGIVGCLHTPIGAVDGVGMEKYGSRLLTLRGQIMDSHLVGAAQLYIEETLPQFQGYVLDFPNIEITKPEDERFTMKIQIEVDSVFGSFNRTLYI